MVPLAPHGLMMMVMKHNHYTLVNMRAYYGPTGTSYVLYYHLTLAIVWPIPMVCVTAYTIELQQDKAIRAWWSNDRTIQFRINMCGSAMYDPSNTTILGAHHVISTWFHVY